MGYKGLCWIKSLVSRVAFSGSVHESFSFSCFAQRTVLYGIQGFVSIKKYCFWGGFYQGGSWEPLVVHKVSRPVQSLPLVFLFCTADRSLWCIRVCVVWKFCFSGSFSDGAGVSHLVLHREPFFLLAIGLRFLFRLENCGHDVWLTIHPTPVEMSWLRRI